MSLTLTYYAGNKRTLNAAAATAHCAMEGKWSAMLTYREEGCEFLWPISPTKGDDAS